MDKAPLPRRVRKGFRVLAFATVMCSIRGDGSGERLTGEEMVTALVDAVAVRLEVC